MNWYLLTSDNSKKILPAANYLLKKYIKSVIPGINIHFIDLKSERIERWSFNVLEKLPQNEDYIVFGLDDYLIIDYIDKAQYFRAINFVKLNKLNRFELGWGASKKEAWIRDNPNARFMIDGEFLEFGKETPYSVSCQISIWRLDKLKEILSSKPMTPWEFETKNRLNNVFCYSSNDCVLRYIEESAISGRQPDKVNILGLRPADVNKIVELGFLNRNELIYGWKGNHEFKGGGEKYDKFYN